MSAQDFLTGFTTGFIAGVAALIVVAVMMKRSSGK